MKKKFLFIILFSGIFGFGCSRGTSSSSSGSFSLDTTNELGQQVTESMASVDDAGGSSSGTFTDYQAQRELKYFASINKEKSGFSIMNYLIPKAEANCALVTFGTCTSTTRTRDFGGCSVGTATLTGSVLLTFAGTGSGSCTIPNASDVVTRTPNFVITGPRGGTFSVTAPSSGQSLTRTGASTFNFSNTGIRRVISANGTTYLDLTTSTVSPIGISGNSRSGRTVTGGILRVTNNSSGVTCDMTPTTISWTASCNCPTAGNWSGTCSNGSALQITYSSTCGSTSVTYGSETKTATMDRCST